MNNKYPQISFVFDRRKIASATTKSSVEMRICYNYKQRFMTTGVKLYANQWKNGKIINCPDMIEVSRILDKMLSDVRQIIFDMQKVGSIDITAIPDRLKQLNAPKITFIDFCQQRAIVRKYGKKKDSQERYDRFIRLFNEYGRITLFEDITEKAIIVYDQYLTDRGLKPYSKWNNYHRFLNSFILDAINEGYLKRNPYKWIHINKQNMAHGLEKCLTPEEFNRIKTVELPTDCLERVRDLFIFQTYTCLSYSDLKDFDAATIQEVAGMQVYIGNRIKTDKPFTIPILSEAWGILLKYNKKLPIISNVKYNSYLKLIAQAAGINKPVSSHWARHTGATLLLNEGVDMKIVAKICGHSSTRITEKIYAKLLDETVVGAIKEIKEKL